MVSALPCQFKKKKIWIRTSAYFNECLTLNRSTTPVSIVLAISQRYQIRNVRHFFIDRIFKPGLQFSLSTWTRPNFDPSEVINVDNRRNSLH